MEFTFGKEKKREKIEELRREGERVTIMIIVVHIYTLYKFLVYIQQTWKCDI